MLSHLLTNDHPSLIHKIMDWGLTSVTKPEANPITSHSGHSRDDIFMSPQLIGIQDFVLCVREAQVLKVKKKKKKSASVKQHNF